MPAQRTSSANAWPKEVKVSNGVATVGGYGVRISVWRGRLRVDDGVGANRRSRLFHRATSGLKRLVVLGHSGYVSLEALRWLTDIKAAYIQIDADSRVLAAFGAPGTDRPALRRAQAIASQTDQALALSRWLVGAKLTAQLRTLRRLARLVAVDEALAIIESYRQLVAGAQAIEDLRSSEAWAAAAYWQALAPIDVRFARRDTQLVPSHWRTFGSRSSPLANGPRLAGNPANAVLNYLYSLLESEATLAARIVGLDPGLGLMHADQPFRDSLAADLMEPSRPAVDAYALELLTTRSFAARDFHETRAGVCRVTAPLTHELAATIPHWGRLVGSVAEDLARALDPSGVHHRGSPTQITGRRRAAGRGIEAGRATAGKASAMKRACAWCGSPARTGKPTCSATCAERMLVQSHEQFAAAGSERLRRFDQSNHPGRTPAARQKQRETRRAQRIAELAWEREHPGPVDRDGFARDIAPKLEGMSARAIARATGLSAGYCATIKRGERVPHPRWWQMLQSALGDGPDRS
jgi:CRISPR-associated endonuclease Cas1